MPKRVRNSCNSVLRAALQTAEAVSRLSGVYWCEAPPFGRCSSPPEEVRRVRHRLVDLAAMALYTASMTFHMTGVTWSQIEHGFCFPIVGIVSPCGRNNPNDRSSGNPFLMPLDATA